MSESVAGPESAAAVLAAVRCSRAVEDAAATEQLRLAVHWAAMHSVDSITHAATIWDTHYGDTAIPVAGPGAPLVAELSVAEFAAAIRLPTEAGKAYLGEAVELRHRLPKTWARVVGGELPAWRARRIARATILLTHQAAAYVDAHVAHVAHTIRLGQLDRLLLEAIGRFMPEETERRRHTAAEGRGVHLNTTPATHEATLGGTAELWGTLDVADALDLDTALNHGAGVLKDLGCTETHDVRRALALGELARTDFPLDLTTQPQDPDQDTAQDTDQDTGQAIQEATDGPAPGPARRGRRGRQVVLYVHLSEAALHPDTAGAGCLGRLENTRSPATAEQIRSWCTTPGPASTRVVVKPVIDLNAHVHVDAYEVPDRLHERTALIHHTCVFPCCTRKARATQPGEHHADCDHTLPHAQGGPTCTCNLAPLCRRHHRYKTLSPWTYQRLDVATYLWTSPQGYHYLRNHHGTHDLNPVHPDREHRAGPPRP